MVFRQNSNDSGLATFSTESAISRHQPLEQAPVERAGERDAVALFHLGSSVDRAESGELAVPRFTGQLSHDMRTQQFFKIGVAYSRALSWLRDDLPAQALESKAMRLRQTILLIAIVSLAATVVALALQTYFGHLFWLVALGPVLAAAGGAAIALSLKRHP